MEIKELVKEAHETAIEKGWWDEPRTFAEQIALIHSEPSEALEELRNGHRPNETYYECRKIGNCSDCKDGICTSSYPVFCKYAKPCGIPSELADTIIRIADTCGYYGIDLEAALREKMNFNKNRPYKHGKQF